MNEPAWALDGPAVLARPPDPPPAAGGVRSLIRDVVAADRDIREGRFQRSLSLIAGLSSVLSGLEVAYEHYRGSYGSA